MVLSAQYRKWGSPELVTCSPYCVLCFSGQPKKLARLQMLKHHLKRKQHGEHAHCMERGAGGGPAPPAHLSPPVLCILQPTGPAAWVTMAT